MSIPTESTLRLLSTPLFESKEYDETASYETLEAFLPPSQSDRQASWLVMLHDATALDNINKIIGLTIRRHPLSHPQVLAIPYGCNNHPGYCGSHSFL